MAYPYGCANMTDFQYFIYSVMLIPVAYLPTTSPTIAEAFAVSQCTVDPFIRQASPVYYNLAFYNFGGDYIINNAVDVECDAYFENLRKKWNINGFVAGVVQSTSDMSTSTSLKVPEVYDNLSPFDLQLNKTPYGRQYMAIASKFSDIWGIS
jgi:hypothetical protein